jgi:hypothetical protein
MVVFLADGWGQKVMELPPAIMPMPLHMVVSEELVLGVMLPMTP